MRKEVWTIHLRLAHSRVQCHGDPHSVGVEDEGQHLDLAVHPYDEGRRVAARGDQRLEPSPDLRDVVRRMDDAGGMAGAYLDGVCCTGGASGVPVGMPVGASGCGFSPPAHACRLTPTPAPHAHARVHHTQTHLGNLLPRHPPRRPRPGPRHWRGPPALTPRPIPCRSCSTRRQSRCREQTQHGLHWTRNITMVERARRGTRMLGTALLRGPLSTHAASTACQKPSPPVGPLALPEPSLLHPQ